MSRAKEVIELASTLLAELEDGLGDKGSKKEEPAPDKDDSEDKEKSQSDKETLKKKTKDDDREIE
jgi:hypothetical protein